MTAHQSPAAFTPGPWRIGDAGTTVFGPPNGNPSPKTIASGLSRADARLIANAPDLLSDLKFMIQTLEVDGYWKRCGGTELAALTNAKRTIAKTENS